MGRRERHRYSAFRSLMTDLEAAWSAVFEVEGPVTQLDHFPAVARPSFASLFLEAQANGRVVSTSTGFVAIVADHPYLVTNRHVVTGRDNNTGQILDSMAAVPDTIVVHHRAAGDRVAWAARSEALLSGARPRWLEHPALGARADVVALPLEDLVGTKLLPYDLWNPGTRLPYDMGSPLNIIGYPFAAQGGTGPAVWIKGFVATEPSFDYSQLPVFLVDARTRPGQSGSPVIAYHHQGAVSYGHRLHELRYPVEYFVGVYSGRINADSDLGMVWRADAVQELLAAAAAQGT